MNRRRPLPPDTRPDWRDPDMPVYGKVKSSRGVKVVLISSEQFQDWAQIRLSNSSSPDYRTDPTYNLRRKP